MNKKALINAIKDDQPDLIKTRIKSIVEALFETMGEALVTQGRFVQPGFGTFTVKTRAARMGRNPSTGEPMQVPESKTIGFKAAPELKSRIN